jgi:N-acetylglucosaminyldiphosphoundecaprenol N-acetyl-beta-D-mannosaminyltransferase
VPTSDHPPTTALPTDHARIEVLGLPVDAVTSAQTLAWVASAVECRRAALLRGDPAPVARQIVTLNPEMAMAARRDPRLRATIHAADLVVPDGSGIVWAAHLLGTPLPERVTGVDLLEAITAKATTPNVRVFLLGAAPGVAAEAARRLSARHPTNLHIFSLAGSPAPADADDVLAAIDAARPDLLFVAFGSPAQERWIAAHRDRLPATVAIGVGGALDFAAGTASRAPRWLRRLGLEWLYRLVRQPWRWRRMMALPHFGALMLWHVATVRLSRVPATRERST